MVQQAQDAISLAANSSSIEARVRDFSELLQKIGAIEDKKRSLWLEIYQNAITDRSNAYMMFAELAGIVSGKGTEHAVHGRTIASYLERMNKANDQLIKLAELVAKAEDDTDDESGGDMYDQINRR
jgi:hypothetical protein